MRYFRVEIPCGLLITVVVVVGMLFSDFLLRPHLGSGAAPESTGIGIQSRCVVFDVAWSADGQSLMSRSRCVEDSATILTVHSVVNTASSHCLWAELQGYSVIDASLSPDGRHVAIINESAELWLLGRDRGDVIEPFATPRINFTKATIANNGRFVAAASADGRIYFYDLNLASSDILDRSSRNQISSIRFSKDDSRMLVQGYDGATQVWELKRRRLLYEKSAQNHHSSADFIDNNTVFTYVDESHVNISDVATGAFIWSGSHNPPGIPGVVPIDVSSNGRNAVWREDETRIVIWDIEHARKQFDIKNPTRVTHVAFSPDGLYLAVAGTESSIRIYDVRTGDQTAQIDTRPRQ